jgi:hypothetical protein
MSDASFKPDPNAKGSYYRRIQDIFAALEKLDVERSSVAVQFIASFFGCEKLALGMVGIQNKKPAVDAYKKKLHVQKIICAAAFFDFSMLEEDIFYLFADEKLQSQLSIYSNIDARSARQLRNRLSHDFGPSNVLYVQKSANFLLPKMRSFLAEHVKVLKYLEANYVH